MSKWNGKRFSIYTSDEENVLSLIEELGKVTNNHIDDIEQKTIETWKELNNKTDLHGDHLGSWQGLSKPTLSQEGTTAQVEKNISDINTLFNQLDKKANDTDLQEQKNRIENLILNSTQTEGNAELIDGRVGINGTTHGTIGNHIRAIEKEVNNLDITNFNKKVFEDSLQSYIHVNATTGIISGTPHGSVCVNVPVNTTINKVNCYVEYECNSSYITSLEQRVQINSEVKKGVSTTITKGVLNEDMTVSSQMVNNATVYFWVNCSESEKNVSYTIKKWVLTVNDNTIYDITEKIGSELNLTFPFNTKGNHTKEVIRNSALVKKDSLYNTLENYKNFLIGEDKYNFNSGKIVNVTKPFANNNEYLGLVKNDISLPSPDKINKVRIKADMLSIEPLKEFTTLLEMTDTNNSVSTLTSKKYSCKQGEVINIDYTFNPTEKNVNINKISVYLRGTSYENKPFKYIFGNVEIYVNDIKMGVNTWFSSISTSEINDYTTLVDKYENLNNSPLKGKNILFFGDSIMDTYSNKRTPYWVCNLTNAKEYNYAVSSSGYSMNAVYNHDKWGTENTNIPAMIEKAYNDGVATDFIVIAAGTNDWDFQKKPFGVLNDALSVNPNINTFYGSLGLTVRTLLKRYPLAKILFVTPLPRKQPNGSGTQHTPKANGLTVIDYSKAIIEVCNYFSMNCLHLTESSGFNLESDIALQTFMPDGLHPSERGAKERHAPRIIKALEEM